MALETAFSCPNRILASLSQLKTLYADEKVPSQEKYGNYAPQAKCHGVSDCRDAVGWEGGSARMAVHRSHDRRPDWRVRTMEVVLLNVYLRWPVVRSGGKAFLAEVIQ